MITVEGTDQSNLPVLAHELEHANQLENGELYLQNGDIAGYDINDEVDAYDIQHKFNFGIGFDVVDLNGNPVTDGPYEVTAEEVYSQFPGVYDNSGGDNDPRGSLSSSGSHP